MLGLLFVETIHAKDFYGVQHHRCDGDLPLFRFGDFVGYQRDTLPNRRNHVAAHTAADDCVLFGAGDRRNVGRNTNARGLFHQRLQRVLVVVVAAVFTGGVRVGSRSHDDPNVGAGAGVTPVDAPEVQLLAVERICGFGADVVVVKVRAIEQPVRAIDDLLVQPVG